MPPKVVPNQDPDVQRAQGRFGVGLSHNNNLELICIVVLAFAGIIIKLSFAEKPSSSGDTGPASCSIWGYGLTAIALSILVFMGINLTSGTGKSKINILKNILPIVLTLFVVLYSIYLNFSFFTRINKDAVSPDYRTYSYMSVAFIILQVIGIATYLSYLANTTNDNKTKLLLSKAGVSILGIINLVFVIMTHITLSAFSTDESSLQIK
jgi:hypothetical protein